MYKFGSNSNDTRQFEFIKKIMAGSIEGIIESRPDISEERAFGAAVTVKSMIEAFVVEAKRLDNSFDINEFLDESLYWNLIREFNA